MNWTEDKENKMENVDVSIFPEEVLVQLDIWDVIEYYGVEDVLSQLDKEKVMEYFDLVERE